MFHQGEVFALALSMMEGVVFAPQRDGPGPKGFPANGQAYSLRPNTTLLFIPYLVPFPLELHKRRPLCSSIQSPLQQTRLSPQNYIRPAFLDRIGRLEVHFFLPLLLILRFESLLQGNEGCVL